MKVCGGGRKEGGVRRRRRREEEGGGGGGRRRRARGTKCWRFVSQDYVGTGNIGGYL